MAISAFGVWFRSIPVLIRCHLGSIQNSHGISLCLSTSRIIVHLHVFWWFGRSRYDLGHWRIYDHQKSTSRESISCLWFLDSHQKTFFPPKLSPTQFPWELLPIQSHDCPSKICHWYWLIPWWGFGHQLSLVCYEHKLW